VERYASALRATDAQIATAARRDALRDAAVDDARGRPDNPSRPRSTTVQQAHAPLSAASARNAGMPLSAAQQKDLIDALIAGTLIDVQGVGECHFVARSPNKKARRGLLVLLPNGSVEAVEESLCIALRRKAFVAGDKVMLSKQALAVGYPQFRWRDGAALPGQPWHDPSVKKEEVHKPDRSSYGVIGVYSGGHLDGPQDVLRTQGRQSAAGPEKEDDLRGKVLKVGVFVNKLEVDASTVLEQVQHEARKGQPQVRILAEVQVDSSIIRPTPAKQHICVTRPVDVTTGLSHVGEMMNMKFREAARRAARSSVSAFSKAQMQAKWLFEEVALHAAAAQGDARELSDMLSRRSASVDSISAKGCTVLGEACRCADEPRGCECIQLLLRNGADPELPDRPAKPPAQLAGFVRARQLLALRPLHIAVLQGNLAASLVLLEANADPLAQAPCVIPSSLTGRVEGAAPGHHLGKQGHGLTTQSGVASALHFAAVCGEAQCAEAILCTVVWAGAGRGEGAAPGGKEAEKAAVDALVLLLERHWPIGKRGNGVEGQGRSPGGAGVPGGMWAKARVRAVRPVSAPAARAQVCQKSLI
jgi:hypothetical protein